MIDMVPVIGKYWTPGSASAAMIRAIQCHPDIQELQRKTAVQEVSAPSIISHDLCTHDIPSR